MNWSYPSRFFGRDVRRTDPRETHALVGTYQKLGLLKGDDFLVLAPVRRQTQYSYNRSSFALTPQPLNPAFLAETISYYQTASYLYQKQLYRELSAEEFSRLLAAPAGP